MENKLNLFFSTALTCTLLSAPVKAADIAANTARMQAMDKITGRVSEIDVPVNGLANFGTFSILVRKCVAKSPEETPENTAFVDIVDNYQTAEPVNIFKGWMFSSTPALNAVEHPIYDIWLLKCYNRTQDRSQLLTTEQLELRDTIPMIRPKAAEISTEMLSVEDNETNTSQPEEETPLEDTTAGNGNEIIKLNINENNETTTAIEEIHPEEEFASEGEEIEEEVIAVNDSPANNNAPALVGTEISSSADTETKEVITITE